MYEGRTNYKILFIWSLIASLNKLISKQNEKLALKISKYMVKVFSNAKGETLILGHNYQERLSK